MDSRAARRQTGSGRRSQIILREPRVCARVMLLNTHGGPEMESSKNHDDRELTAPIISQTIKVRTSTAPKRRRCSKGSGLRGRGTPCEQGKRH